MTYADLLKELQQLDETQLNSDVTIFIMGIEEFYPSFDRLYFSTEEDEDGQILDAGHPYLMVWIMILDPTNSQHIDFNDWLAQCPVQWFKLDSDDDQVSYQFIIDTSEEEDN